MSECLEREKINNQFQVVSQFWNRRRARHTSLAPFRRGILPMKKHDERYQQKLAPGQPGQDMYTYTRIQSRTREAAPAQLSFGHGLLFLRRWILKNNDKKCIRIQERRERREKLYGKLTVPYLLTRMVACLVLVILHCKHVWVLRCWPTTKDQRRWCRWGENRAHGLLYISMKKDVILWR